MKLLLRQEGRKAPQRKQDKSIKYDILMKKMKETDLVGLVLDQADVLAWKAAVDAVDLALPPLAFHLEDVHEIVPISCDQK